MLLEVAAQSLSRQFLDDEPEPVDVGAVLPGRARIIDEWYRETPLQSGERMRLTRQLVVALQFLVEEEVAEAPRVGHQLTHRGLAGRRAQAWFVAVEAVQD